jgi:hypothetical protein
MIEPSYPLDEPKVHETFGDRRCVVSKGGGFKLVEECPRPDELLGIGKVTSLRELGEWLACSTTEEP